MVDGTKPAAQVIENQDFHQPLRLAAAGEIYIAPPVSFLTPGAHISLGEFETITSIPVGLQFTFIFPALIIEEILGSTNQGTLHIDKVNWFKITILIVITVLAYFGKKFMYPHVIRKLYPSKFSKIDEIRARFPTDQHKAIIHKKDGGSS